MGESAAVAAAGTVHGFPAELTSFIGRDGPVREVAALLAAHRLVTVTGPGGSGKTRLAAAVARQVAGRFADGAWLIELAPMADAAQLPSAVAATLGIREDPGMPAAPRRPDAPGPQHRPDLALPPSGFVGNFTPLRERGKSTSAARMPGSANLSDEGRESRPLPDRRNTMVTQLPHRDTHPRTPARAVGLHFGRLATVLGAVTVALLSFVGAVPAAFASMMPHPGPGGAYGPVPVGVGTITHLIVTGGMPGWQIALIALGAAVVAAAAAVTLDRTVGRRRPVSAITA